jgi:OOP family OmpA-OmpF porin
VKHKIHFPKSIIVAGLLLGASSAALADQQPYGYLGLGIGSSTYDWDSSKCTQKFQDLTGSSSVACTVSTSQSGGKLFAGYQATPNLGFEFGLYDFGELTGTVSGPGGSAGIKLHATAINADLIGSLPLADSGITLSLKGGIYSAGSNATSDLGDDSTSNNTGIDFGGRVSFNFSRNVTGRVDFETFQDVGDDFSAPKTNINLVSVGFAYSFR